jgi:putative ABC transport system ATP-binding protein
MPESENKKNVFSINKDFVFEYKKGSFFSQKTAGNWELRVSPQSVDESNQLNVKQGFVAILGESGSGKSTLMSVLSGFEKLPESRKGEILFIDAGAQKDILEKDFAKYKEESFGYVFQRCYESKPLSAIDNVALPLFIKEHSDESVQYCEELLESANLEGIGKKNANELSGGQLTRIGILRGFAQNPKILFADEPTNNLDPQNALRIMRMLRSWIENKKGTVIMITHYLEHALEFADQIIILKSKGQDKGEIVFQRCKTDNNWTLEQEREIRAKLETEESFKGFPEPRTDVKPKYRRYLSFLSKIAVKNITSKADGSRTVSLITFIAFLSLFFIFFSGNQIVSWLTKIDELKNSTSFLRRFEIRVMDPDYLSQEIQNTINDLTVREVRQWLAAKINKELEEIAEKSAKYGFSSPPEVLCNSKNRSICEENAGKLINPETWIAQSEDVISILQEYSRYLHDTITENTVNPDINLKQVKYAEKNFHDVVRLTEFFIDVSKTDDLVKTGRVYPRWDSAPQFVKKDGIPMGLTTGLLWLDYNDPFFDDPRLKYLTNSDFRFKSENDPGIIIDKETLADELDYDLKTEEVKIYYDTGEHACIPVKAVVERIPGGNYHALSTFGFGEKIRSSSQHCDDKKKFYQFHIKLSERYDFAEIWDEFNKKGNKDEYGNLITDFAKISDNSYEIYCEYKYAKTKSGWEKWVIENLLLIKNDFELLFENSWEVVKEKEKEPPYRQGTVYAASKNCVPALGEFLCNAYREDPKKGWKIESYGYESKIKFAKQSEMLLSSIKNMGISLFLGLFILFLSTNMLINVRNKATEIAIFRAMGGTVLSILYIFNLQVLMILVSAAFLALIALYAIIPLGRSIFIENVIYSIWENIDEQREAIQVVSNENLWSVFATNQAVILSSIGCVLFVVSIAVLYVRYSRHYAVAKILKER